MKALLEAIQVRLPYFIGARKDVEDNISDEKEYQDILSLSESASLSKVRFLKVDMKLDAQADLNKILNRLEAVGLQEIYVLNSTFARFGVYSCSAYIPGLEGSFYDAEGNLYVGPRGQGFLNTE